MLRRIVWTVSCLAASTVGFVLLAQQPAAEGGAKKEKTRPAQSPLFFKEEWKTVPGLPTEHPITQVALSNQNLELKLYGVAGKDIQENGTEGDNFNPLHVWTGLCTSPCGLMLRDKNNMVDLTGPAKIRWFTKVSGFHMVRPMLKLADGTVLVGDHVDGSITDYHPVEFAINEVRWIKMDAKNLWTRGNLLDKDKVDLTKVDEVGFADLIPGSGHGDGGYVDVGFIEVYGKPVRREGGSATQQQQ